MREGTSQRECLPARHFVGRGLFAIILGVACQAMFFRLVIASESI